MNILIIIGDAQDVQECQERFGGSRQYSAVAEQCDAGNFCKQMIWYSISLSKKNHTSVRFIVTPGPLFFSIRVELTLLHLYISWAATLPARYFDSTVWLPFL
jgi:hypothetical protein